jgi:hypothetical protein
VTASYGYCQCGCYQKTWVATQTNRKLGYVKGEPVRYVRGHNRSRVPNAERQNFSERYEVDAGTGCWTWTWFKDHSGYGRLICEGEQQAHRVFYKRHVGPIPSGAQLDHLCRNRACVNPAHLEPVTAAENVRRGKNAKFSAAKIREIRDLCAQGWVQADIARAYGTTDANISAIKRERNWVGV